MKNTTIEILNSVKEDADKFRRFDKRTKVVKQLQKNGIELLDRKQDGCLYIKDTFTYYKIYFQETREGLVKIYCILECNAGGIPLNRINLTNK